MTQQQTLVTSTQVATQEERRQQTVARLLGAQSFGAIHWQRLLQEGALVELHIGHCGFTTRMTLDDMGIQIDDDTVRQTVSRWMTFGEKRLLPETYMKRLGRIEGRARAVRNAHAFHSELGYFVPTTAYAAWLTQTEALRAAYLALRDEILVQYDDLVRQVLEEYGVIAADTYQRLHATHPQLVCEGRQAFVASYTNRIAEQIPSQERIRTSFRFHFFRVPGAHPLGIPAESTTAQEQGISGVSRTEQQAQQRAVIEQDMRQDARQRVQTMLDEWLTTLVGHLRVLVYDAATDVLATMQRRGGDRFSGRSTMQLHNLLEQIRSLNFFGDTEIDQIMARIEQIVNLTPAERQRSMGEIQQTFRAIATTTRATLLDLGQETRAPHSDLGIAAIPTQHLVNVARAELRLPPLDPARLEALSLSASVRGQRAELADTPLWGYAEQASRSARVL